MWLLDTDTVQLVHFMDDREVAGKYAILSHTWKEEEVTFAAIATDEAKGKKGYYKIERTCHQAKANGLKYAWVDTCCINKDSSAELSEAINSMYKWYANSQECYVYLCDWKVEQSHEYDQTAFWGSLAACRWFTRGWTLQELIAPSLVHFFDKQWMLRVRLGKIHTYFVRDAFPDGASRIIADMAGIDGDALNPPHQTWMQNLAISRKLSWAAHRQTTRVEDQAYCLLGLLGITMPLLYGEGPRAFTRLQEELLKTSTDLSILLWEPYLTSQMRLLLAPDIYCYRYAAQFEPCQNAYSTSMTNAGLQITVLMNENRDSALLRYSYKTAYESLDCRYLNLRVKPGWPKHSHKPDIYEVARYPGASYDNMVPSNSARKSPDTEFHSEEILLVRKGEIYSICLELGPGLEMCRIGAAGVGSRSYNDRRERLIESVVWSPDLQELWCSNRERRQFYLVIRDCATGAVKLLLFEADLVPEWIDVDEGNETRIQQLRADRDHPRFKGVTSDMPTGAILSAKGGCIYHEAELGPCN